MILSFRKGNVCLAIVSRPQNLDPVLDPNPCWGGSKDSVGWSPAELNVDIHSLPTKTILPTLT